MGSNGIKWAILHRVIALRNDRKVGMETQEIFETSNQWSELMWSQISQKPRQLPIPRPHLKLPHLCREIQAMQGSLLNCQGCFSDFLWHSKWIWVFRDMAVCQNLVALVNIKIAGKWMFIPLKMVLIGIDPYPYVSVIFNYQRPASDSMCLFEKTDRLGLIFSNTGHDSRNICTT